MYPEDIKTLRVQDGKFVDFIAEAETKAGDPVLLPGGRAGIVQADTPLGGLGAAEVEPGVIYKGRKTAAESGAEIPEDTEVFYNSTTGTYATFGTFSMGTSVETAASASDEVMFALNIRE